MAGEAPLKPPRGVKSLKPFLAALAEQQFKNRPIASETVSINEMPDGKQLVAKATAGGNLSVVVAVWPGPVSKLVDIVGRNIRDVPESEP